MGVGNDNTCSVDDYNCRLVNCLVSEGVYQKRVEDDRITAELEMKVDRLLHDMGADDHLDMDGIIEVRGQFLRNLDLMLSDPVKYEDSITRLDAESLQHEKTQVPDTARVLYGDVLPPQESLFESLYVPGLAKGLLEAVEMARMGMKDITPQSDENKDTQHKLPRPRITYGPR